MYTFTKKDIGCYADGAFGEGHRRDVLRGLMADLGETVLHDALSEEPLYDYDDEDEAIRKLNAVTEPGLYWEMVEGDLMLIENDETEDTI